MKMKEAKSLTTQEKKKIVIDDYNDIAEDYANDFFDDSSDEKYIDIFLQKLDGKQIMDVGCGNGRECKYMVEKGFHVTGIDLSPEMLKIAKERVPHVEFKIMDISNITYPENSFDGIIANSSLFHVPIEELPKVLNSFRKILKQNGKMLLILQEGDGEVLVEEPYKPGVFVYMYYFSEGQILNMLRDYGFQISYLERKTLSNEFELGNSKLIIISIIKK